MSRIIAGTAGGLRLVSVPGESTRPTTDRVKESLFSKLESYDVVQGARVLDAYAGSGALGCEALSRGAASVEFVEKYPKACEITRRNVAATSKIATGITRVTQGSAQSYVAVHSGPWDLVFLDPPYA
ncbi:MAG: RsmD family RNA methyltransferase, partial [Rothia dentocariosa]